MLRRGRAEECVNRLRFTMETLDGAGFTLFKTIFQSVEASALSQLGRHGEAIRLIDEAVEHCAESGERWCLAELHRIRAEIVLRQATPDARRLAMKDLMLAKAAADQDGAVAWKRRIDTNIETLADGYSNADGLNQAATGSA